MLIACATPAFCYQLARWGVNILAQYQLLISVNCLAPSEGCSGLELLIPSTGQRFMFLSREVRCWINIASLFLESGMNVKAYRRICPLSAKQSAHLVPALNVCITSFAKNDPKEH
ncbi:unnamed protein product [Ilex paraguariensis]|uniref:Uncharacterized protein n=1 Tax=Ilex paraguariensis TaxID=185542 RepID=A0ABC8SAJ6_9AQUA